MSCLRNLHRRIHWLTWLLMVGLVVSGAWSVRAEAWQSALAEQTDPVKLAALGDRGANPRVNRIVYYLHEAQADGVSPEAALDEVLKHHSVTGAVAGLTREIQVRNYQHALEWGLFTAANLEKLKRGQSATITKGHRKGEDTDVDHIVPFSLAREAGNSLANLELQPASVNRAKGNRVDLYSLKHATKLREAGVITRSSYFTVWWVFIFSQLFWVLKFFG